MGYNCGGRSDCDMLVAMSPVPKLRLPGIGCQRKTRTFGKDFLLLVLLVNVSNEFSNCGRRAIGDRSIDSAFVVMLSR